MKLKLTLLSKFLLICVLIIFACLFLYGLFGIVHVTSTSKVIVNDKLIVDEGWYWFKPETYTKISDFPNSFDLFGKLDMQMSDGSIYHCEFIIKSTIDEKWVINHKKSPIIEIPQYSLNSYILDYVGNMKPSILYLPETKTQIEDIIENWLKEHIQDHGIIINDIRIYTPFIQDLKNINSK